MDDDSHEPINKDDLQGREVDAETIVSQDSESSSQVSGTMDIQKEEDVVEEKSTKGSIVDTKHMEKEKLKKYGALIWYGEQCDTESSGEAVYDDDDAELQDEDTTLSSAEKTDLPTEDDDDEATELSENEAKHIGLCKEESKQMKKGEDTKENEKENILADEEDKMQESNEEEDWQESNKDDRQESNEEKSTADEDESTQDAEEGNIMANEEEDRQEAEEDDMQEDEVENMADEDNKQESNEEEISADENEDTQEGEEGNIIAKEDDRQEAEEDDMQEDEVENIMADEDNKQESIEEETTVDENEDTQEGEEGHIAANGEEDRQEAEEYHMQEDEEENIMVDEENDKQESNEEKTTADEDENTQGAEEGNIMANEEENKQEAEEDDMQEDEVENIMADEDSRQESNEEETTADENEDTQEGEEGNIIAKEDDRQEAEEDDMLEDEVENIMADEDSRQESNEEETTVDKNEDTQEDEEGGIAANEEEDRQEAEEDDMQEDEVENMSDEDNKQESNEEEITADENEDTQEGEEGNIIAKEDDRQEAEEDDMLEDEVENIMADEEDDRQESNEEETTAEDEDMQEGEEGNIAANEEEDRQEAEEENIMVGEENDRQESNEEKTAAEDEDMQEGEEGNIAANEEEGRQETEEDDVQEAEENDMQEDEEENIMVNEENDMLEDEEENIMVDEEDTQESKEERIAADDDEDTQEGEEGNIVANEEENREEAEEDDMLEDEEENIMADEEEDTQVSNEERIAADDDDMQEAEEENMADDEENILEDEDKNMADEEKDMQESEEENRPESEEENVMAVEEENTQEAEEGKIMADEEDSQVGERGKITGEEESLSQSEEGKEEVKREERMTDEEEEKQEVKPICEGNEGKNIQDIWNVHASEAEDLPAANDENTKCGKEGEIPPDHHICKERQSTTDNEEVTTDQDATEVNSGDIQKSNNDGSVTEETICNAKKSPVLGQKHRRRTLSFDSLEITKTTSESKSFNNSDKRTPPGNSGEVQTSGESQINRTSPIIGSRLRDTSGSPCKHDVTGLIAERKFNLVITSVRGNVADFTESNKDSQAADHKKLASGSSDVSKNKSSTSQEKNIECVEIVSESEEDNVFEECKAVVCKKCRSIWTEKVLHTIFKGSEAVTVNSKITFGAIVLINNWAHKHIQHNRETAVKNMLERADLGRNIKGLEISDLSQWLFELMDKGKIKCCAVFDAIYKPEPLKVSLSSLKKGASSKDKIASCENQDEGEMSEERLLQLEEERLADSRDISKVPEVTKGANTKKEREDELVDVLGVQDHRLPDRTQTIDAQVSRLSPRQSGEVTTEENESLYESHSSISEIQSEAVLNDDQVSAKEEVLSETESSQAEEVSYVYEENDMEVGDHEEGGNDETDGTPVLRQEEEIEADLQTTKEGEILSDTVEDRQSLLCKKLGLDINNIDISCSSSDMKRVNNGAMAKQVSVEKAISHAHINLLKERSALHGFASEAFDLLPFELENFYVSAHNDESTQRFMTNRELLTLHSIFILDAELPNAELFYQVLIQILMSRNQVLLVPDSRTLLQVLEKLRRDFNRAKVGKSYSEFLAQNWDMRNVYSAESLWNNKRGYPNNPNIRNVLSIFCLWKNIGKQLTGFYPSLAIQEMCKFIDLSSTDKLGMCVRLYARFCTFLYKENHPELAELFLDQKFTISNISVSRDNLINSMKCQASENQRVEASLTSTETEVIQAMQNCTEAEKMALRSENPKTLRHFQRLLKQFEQKLDRYRDANAELVKRIRVAEARKEKLVNKIKDPSLKGSLQELTDELSTICRNKRKNSSLSEADQRSAKVARMESEPCEVAESTKEVIHNILAKGVKPELVRTVIQTIMKKVTGESALNLPDVFWIRKYAQENGFLSTES